jgi:hypothetical protein
LKKEAKTLWKRIASNEPALPAADFSLFEHEKTGFPAELNMRRTEMGENLFGVEGEFSSSRRIVGLSGNPQARLASRSTNDSPPPPDAIRKLPLQRQAILN